MRDIMPSKSLVIHEYRTHGTCSGLDPEHYFGVTRQLYERINVPPEFKATDARSSNCRRSEIEREFLAANPWLKPEMISVSCRKGESSRYSRVLRPRSRSAELRAERGPEAAL